MTHPHTLTAYRRRHIDLHLTASALCQRSRLRPRLTPRARTRTAPFPLTTWSTA